MITNTHRVAPTQAAGGTPDAPDAAWANEVRNRTALAAQALGEAMSYEDRAAALDLPHPEIADMRPLAPSAAKQDFGLD